MSRLRMASLCMTVMLLCTAVTAQAAPQGETLRFGVLSTESSQNMKKLWAPFLQDMEKVLNRPIQAFFASDYAGLIEGMRFNKVDLCWLGGKAAIMAVDRANSEVFAQVTDADGVDGYYSLLVVHKDSPLNSVEDMLAKAKDLNFSNGDPNSTSGFLVPSYYVFAQNGVDAKKIFKNVVSANHESNALAVANKQVDVATFNSEGLQRLQIVQPAKAQALKIIWTSPLIPKDPLVWRKDLDPTTKKQIIDFVLSYGTTGPDKERQIAILNDLKWGLFKKSSDAQLIPLRKLEFFRDRTKVEHDPNLSAEEKNHKLAEIDANLAKLP